MNLLNSLGINAEKIKLFISTGLQGFYKLLILFFFEIKYGLTKAGEFGIHLSVSQIICTFTVIGFCSLILSRISSENINKKKYELFYGLVFNILICLAISLILIHLFNKFFQIIFFLEISFWLFSWTIYFTSRHFFLAERKFNIIIITDSILIFLSILIITSNYFLNVSIILSIVMILVSFLNFLIIGNFSFIRMNQFKIETKGFLFGGAQFLSSSFILLLIPVSVFFLNSEEVGIIAIFVNLISASIIISRTVSLYLITDFSKNKLNKFLIKKKIKSIQNKITLYSFFIFLINLVILKFIISFYEIINFELTLSLFFISLYFLANNFTILYSSLIIINEQAKENFLIHIILFIIFIIFIYFSYFYLNNYNFLLICFVLSSIGFLRFIKIKRIYNEKKF